MNLFTRFLARNNRDADLQTLIAHWDRLEAVTIAVFKGKRAGPDDEAEYAEVRAWLLAHYPAWEAALAPHWRQTLTAERPTAEDPFRRIFRAERAADLVGDWGAMQHLAAAREALNRLVLARGERLGD